MKRNNVTLTVNEELNLVASAKAGDITARDRLYMAYAGEIETFHNQSAVGLTPKKFGRGRNEFGCTYEADCGRVFQVFTNALESFDCNKVDLSAFHHINPFLSYLKYEITHRALDEVRKEDTYRKRYTTMSDLKKNAQNRYDQDGDNAPNDDDLMAALYNSSECVGEHGFDYDYNADDQRNAQLKMMTNTIIELCPRDSMEYKTLTNFLAALGYADNVIPEVAARMSVSKPTIYKYINSALKKVPAKMAQEFRDALAA